MKWTWKRTLLALLLINLTALAALWLIPLPVFQEWSGQRIEGDDFAHYENQKQTAALVWVTRYGLILLLLSLFLMYRRATTFAALKHAFINRLQQVRSDFQQVFSTQENSRRVSICFCVLLTGWVLLAVSHNVRALLQRSKDAAYYKFDSGHEVLPNISSSNRHVIRYVKEATPEDARILVVSDQKLFFLSYYLLPRRLFHVMHPDAEFVIPLANQERQLAAYERHELDEQKIRDLQPDFILEYFEGEKYLDRDRLGEDPRWVYWWQQREQSAELPPFLVVLHPYEAGDQR